MSDQQPPTEPSPYEPCGRTDLHPVHVWNAGTVGAVRFVTCAGRQGAEHGPDGSESEPESDQYLLHRITIDLVLNVEAGPDDETQTVSVSFVGDPPLVTALGMLRMAEDSMLAGPDEDEES